MGTYVYSAQGTIPVASFYSSTLQAQLPARFQRGRSLLPEDGSLTSRKVRRAPRKKGRNLFKERYE